MEPAVKPLVPEMAAPVLLSLVTLLLPAFADHTFPLASVATLCGDFNPPPV